MSTNLMIEEHVEFVRAEQAKMEEVRAGLIRARQGLRTANLEQDADHGHVHSAAYEAARKRRDETKASIANLKAQAAELRAWQLEGDRSIKATDIRGVEDEIESHEAYLVADQAQFKQAERLLSPYRAGNELALLAADVLERVTDAPILIYTEPAHAPLVEPSIILSQSTPSEGYGITPEVTGRVDLTLVGDPAIDWRMIDDAFAREGCQGRFDPDGLMFTRAVWPTPHLVSPSDEAVYEFGRIVCDAWGDMLLQTSAIDQLRQRGYSVQHVSRKDLVPLSAIEMVAIEAAEGLATGTVMVRLGVERTGLGAEVNADQLIFDAKELMWGIGGLLGTQTAAGTVADYEIVEVQPADGAAWGGAATYGQSGHPLWPATIEVTIRVTYLYEPVEV